MIRRIVEVSNPASLSLAHNQLRLRRHGEEDVTIPIEDLGVLVIANQAVSITEAVHAACAENNTSIVFCDARFMPVSICLPLVGNEMAGRITRSQARVSLATRKRLWKGVVQEKIRNQATTLQLFGAEAEDLLRLIPRVRAGDSGNLEGVAAQRYWTRLFGRGFRRRQDAPGLNGLLNYGYAIIRAATARAIVASGLHPSFGLHHSNQYNSFTLADDLMEPYRPWVDARAAHITHELPEGDVIMIDQSSKQALIGLLTDPALFSNRRFPFMTALQLSVATFRDVLMGEGREVRFVEQ